VLQEVGHGGGLDPFDLDLGPVVESRRGEGTRRPRGRRVGQVDVLADDADAAPSGGRLHLVDQFLQPDRSIGWAASSNWRSRRM